MTLLVLEEERAPRPTTFRSRPCVDCGGPTGYVGKLRLIVPRCTACESTARPGSVDRGLAFVRFEALEMGKDRGRRGLPARKWDVSPHLVRDYLAGYAIGWRELREAGERGLRLPRWARATARRAGAIRPIRPPQGLG